MTGPICRECAIKGGYEPARGVCGVWPDQCGVCHETKPCTDAVHDWRKIGYTQKEALFTYSPEEDEID